MPNALHTLNGGRIGKRESEVSLPDQGIFTFGNAKPTMVPDFATANMTLDATWDGAYSTSFSDLSSATSASVKVQVDMLSTDEGVIMEAGGSGDGLILYAYSGTLYFQCGDGSGFGSASNRAEVSWTITDGIHVIEWSAAGIGSFDKAVLYIDKAVVDTDIVGATRLAGGDNGGRGEIHDTAGPANRGNWTSDGSGVYTNQSRIGPVEIYNGEVTEEVQN